MAEHVEEVISAASPAPSDHKRKHEVLEPDAPEPQQLSGDSNGNSASDAAKKAEEDDPETKQPRLEDKLDILAKENRCQEEKVDETEEVGAQASVENNSHLQNAPQPSEDTPDKVNEEELAADQLDAGIEQPSDENVKMESAKEEPSKGELLGPPEETQDPSADVPQEGDISSIEQQDTSDAKTMSRKIEVPNNKVGVLIGKLGETIKHLQLNSGARIQITRDADADPYAGNRPVELIGTLENINKAEKLIKDVIAEADAGGSPALVAQGFSTVQAAEAGEQIKIQVPNERVGLIIGKNGETIRGLQMRSGARIQLIPQRLPEGSQLKERTLRVTGDKKQIGMAREMIKEVMDQDIRSSSISTGHNLQGFRPRGPVAQWGPRGAPPSQQTGYDYIQRGPYQSQNPQYPPQTYSNYPPQQPAPRSNFGWEQRPPPHASHDYYVRQGGHAGNASGPSPVMGPTHSHANYNYGQPAPYRQTAPPLQSYGHGYNETKYENQVSMRRPYRGHGASQPSPYPQGTTNPGYGSQEQYGKPASYGVPQRGPHLQSYGQPRTTQPGEMPYQGPISSGQMQKTYPPYGSRPPASGSAPGYPQQGGGQPVSGYCQPGGQQVYAQMGPTITYGQYPSSQPGYTEQVQVVPNNAAVYGYQGADDPAYSARPGASCGEPPPSGQPTYPQVAPTQPGYDQSVQQSGGYATLPQPGYPPQYDASQMYGAHR